jgi:hypothetical protein
MPKRKKEANNCVIDGFVVDGIWLFSQVDTITLFTIGGLSMGSAAIDTINSMRNLPYEFSVMLDPC